MHLQEWAGKQEGVTGGEYHHNTLYACVKPSEIKKKNLELLLETKESKKMTCDWPFSTLLRGISSAKEDRGAGLTGFLGLERKKR